MRGGEKISSKSVMFAVMFVLVTVGIAAADMASDISNITTIIGNSSYGLVGFFVSTLGIFMQWPLSLFVALGIFLTFVKLVSSFLIHRGKGGK